MDATSDGGGAPKGLRRWISRVAVAAAVVLVVLVILKGSCSGYDTRRVVSEAIGEAAAVKARVEEFYRKNAALPGAADAPAFRIDATQASSARRIEWNATARSVVITMDGEPYAGKRFAFEPVVRDGRLDWTCRSIDIDVKYLPAACR
jgi:hypothetical protein